MIPIKTPQEIAIMKKGGKILTQAFSQVMTEIKPGVKLADLDKKAEKLILKAGAKPSFKMVDKYRYTTCLNINEGIVHGIPDQYQIKSGDLVTLDMGVYYQGFHTDMARTLWVAAKGHPRGGGIGGREVAKFLKTGQLALKKAIVQARPGRRVGHISQMIQKTVEAAGYNVARTLTGHGLGQKLHEKPVIPCFLKGKIGETPKLKPGMTLAIEVIYTQGQPRLVHSEKDQWTLRTADGKLSGLFENTVLITSKRPFILTDLEAKLSLS